MIAPRGSGKSAWASFAYPFYAAVNGLEPFIQIISDTAGQAREWLENIRNELEDNERLAQDYPAVCDPGPVWRQDRLVLRNGVVISALGTGSKIRGRRNRAQRPTLLILDDPENDEHVTSAIRRERSKRWFDRAVMNAGTPATNILVLGTTLHADCLVMKLKRSAGWRTRTFQSIVEWPKRMDLWEAWEALLNDWEDPEREAKALAFYDANREAMEA